MKAARPNRTTLYVMNDWFGGGAQTGLITLIDSGFFKGQNLHVLALIRGDGRIEAALRKRLPASHIHLISRARKMRPHHLLKAVFRYPLLLKKLHPQTIILSLPQANLLGRLWAYAFTSPSLITFEHNTRYAKSLYAPLLKLLSGRVHGIITDTPATAQQALASFYRPGSRFNLNLPLFSGRHKAADVKTAYTPKKPLQLLIAGRLTAAKNHAVILQAMKILNAQGYPAQLHLAGSGELESSLRRQAQTLGLAKQVTFHGYVADWTKLCKKTDIYLQPSHYEGLCITVLEAMAHGMPVIASPVGGLRDYGKPQHNLLFINPNEPAELAGAIASLTNPALAKRLGLAARHTIAKHYAPATYKKHIAAARKKLGWA